MKPDRHRRGGKVVVIEGEETKAFKKKEKKKKKKSIPHYGRGQSARGDYKDCRDSRGRPRLWKGILLQNRSREKKRDY